MENEISLKLKKASDNAKKHKENISGDTITIPVSEYDELLSNLSIFGLKLLNNSLFNETIKRGKIGS